MDKENEVYERTLELEKMINEIKKKNQENKEDQSKRPFRKEN